MADETGLCKNRCVEETDLIPGIHFGLGEDMVFGKQIDVFLIHIMRQSIGGGTQVIQAAFFRFGHPFIGIVVAVEDDALMFGIGLNDQIMQILFKVRAVFQLIGKFGQRCV